MEEERNKKMKLEKCWVWFGEEERVNVKKKEKRKKEREKLNLMMASITLQEANQEIKLVVGVDEEIHRLEGNL